MSRDTLPVAECFGPVWQGEGPAAGRRCSFLRLGLCNLHCSWCDTPYTWDRTRYDVAAQCPERHPASIAQSLSGHDTDLLVVSGGEPMLHAGRRPLRDLLAMVDHEVHVETNGTIAAPTWLALRVALFVVSPKVAQDDDTYDRRIRPVILERLVAETACVFKIVVRHDADVAAAAVLADRVGLPRGDLWLMPEGTTAEAVIERGRALAPAVEAAGANLTLRQHILLYGDRRGT